MSIMPISQINNNNHDNMKRGVLLTSALGTATAYGIIAHRKGFTIPKIAKSDMKDWAIFTLKNDAMKIEEPEVIGLAAGSVAGGLIGGAIFDDKSQFKAKLRESLSQMVGNVGIPILCVGQATRFYKRHEKGFDKLVPQIKGENKGFTKIFNRTMKAVPPVGVTTAALVTGIFTGNRVSNFINEKLSHRKISREIRGTDFAPHVDDVCLGITLMAPHTQIGAVISKTVPFFLTVPGYETGVARD